MRLTVKAVVRARQESVEGPLADGSYKVKVSTPPVDGAANQRISELLASHFGCRTSEVRIVSGQTSTRKVFECPDRS